ncbi:uncharacterized protein EV154DRAFT_519633 [Mucor mucedo]|uniref:uncharacterized protein n=1 Tax=Mucor mucedo TaxID=29922 RepID=UPI00221F8F93|nr:uncharacterized protein EV154DRAFT_519633 [Mucor mucedo]KAI7887848.1 hypothetical protein EV154DRAFT_519633 [Mucor mucedo]
MSKNNSRGWLFGFSLLSMENIALHDHLLEKVRLHDNYSAHLPEHTPFIVARKRFVKEKIRHHYEHLADNEKKKTWDEDKLKLLAENNRRKSRMQTKMRRRKAAFARYKDAFELKYGPDCEEFVDRAYMSEEENNELDEYGNALNFFNLVPKWRTPKLQEFVNELDKPILAIKPSACKRCTRTPIPEETTSVPLDILATLPSWGVDPNVFL